MTSAPSLPPLPSTALSICQTSWPNKECDNRSGQSRSVKVGQYRFVHARRRQTNRWKRQIIQCYPPEMSLEDYCPTPTTRTQVTFPCHEKTLMLEKKSKIEKNVDILHGRFSLKAVDLSMAGEKKSAHLGATRLGAGPTRSSRDLTCPWLAPTHRGLAVSCRETRGPGHRRARAPPHPSK